MHQACFSSNNSARGCDTSSLGTDNGCWLLCGPIDCPNPATQPTGPVHGIRPDGRVDISAKEAWPNRPAAAVPPTPEEVADACAAFAACIDVSSTPSGSGLFGTLTKVDVQQACLNGSLEPLAVNAAERVIPLTSALGVFDSSNESWEFFVRSVLAAHADCSAIHEVLTRRDSAIDCQEDGCYATEPRTATCDGDVANFEEVWEPRDCSRSGMHCSAASPTGCTDRALVRCTSGAKDRCDGDIKLGCDDCGFVSFHDCSWNGGHCVESADGAACVPPNDSTGCAVRNGCTGATLSLCAAGGPVAVDCAALGFQGCTNDTSRDDICSLDSQATCTLAHCDAAPQSCDAGTSCGAGGSGGTTPDASVGAGGTP